jgi:hypothetical protein
MTTPYTTFQNIIDPSGKRIFDDNADMTSIGVDVGTPEPEEEE